MRQLWSIPTKTVTARNRGVNYSADVDLTWKVPFVDGLSIGVLGSFNGNNRNNSELQKSYQLYDYFTNQPTKTYGENRYQNTMGIFQKLYGRAQVNYMNSFGKHNVNVTGVVEASVAAMMNCTDVVCTMVISAMTY